MNILFVNNNPANPEAGGIERVTDVLTKEFVKRGHKVSYLCERIDKKHARLLNYDFPVEVYQLPVNGRFNNSENASFYKSLLNQLRIDVVINQRALSGWYNDLLGITDTKMISVLHSRPDATIIEYPTLIMDLTSPPFTFLKKIIKFMLYPIIKTYWVNKLTKDIRTLYNDLAKKSSAIVTLSSKDLEIFKTYITPSSSANIIPISNPNTFSEYVTCECHKEKVLLYVGRLKKSDKNPFRLLKIWKRIHKKHPCWHLKIVGDGPEYKRMSDYVKAQKLSNVFFEGSQSDVAPYYRTASIVCQTSNFEGWGMSLTEGMQYGCIPITFDSYGAAREIIDDGVNGCLIPSFSIKEYANRLSELMDDEEKRVLMAKSALEKVKTFSAEIVADQWEKLFEIL